MSNRLGGPAGSPGVEGTLGMVVGQLRGKDEPESSSWSTIFPATP